VSSGHTPFLGQLGAVDAEALIGRVRRKVIPNGQSILRVGAAGDEVVLVLGGG
jgi:hypothetical protein